MGVNSNALCVSVLLLPESCVFLAAAKFALIREKLAFAPHSNSVYLRVLTNCSHTTIADFVLSRKYYAE